MKPVPHTEAVSRPWSAVAIVRDVFVAPGRAYAAIAASPGWLGAYLATLVASAISLALTIPALAHLAVRLAAGDASAGALTIGSASRALAVQNGTFDAIEPVIGWGLAALLFSFAARLRGERVPFRTLFALAAYGSLPASLGSVVQAIAIRAHDPASFATFRELFTALPVDLAVFAPAAASDRSAVFLGSFGLFDLWAAIVTAFGVARVAKVSVAAALVAALTADVVLALAFAG